MPATLDHILTALADPTRRAILQTLSGGEARVTELARPFAISLEHLQQVVATVLKPAASGNQTHAAYITELLARVQRGEEEAAFAKMIADLEPELYSQAIQQAQGNQARAARWLGITRLKMRKKLIQLGLHPDRELSQKGSKDSAE